MRTWEAALRARASGSGADADSARLVLAELERLREIERAARQLVLTETPQAWERLTRSLQS